jgi:excisionase family DNA binding protein
MTVERLAYTTQEVAQMLGVSTKTVYRMVQTGKLTKVHIGEFDREYRITKESIDKLLNRGDTSGSAECSLQPDTNV